MVGKIKMIGHVHVQYYTVADLGEVRLVRTNPPQPYPRTCRPRGEWPRVDECDSDAITWINVDNGFS